jgi:multidrug resistance efflux pump
MLNITENSIGQSFKLTEFGASKLLIKSRVKRLSIIIIAGLILGILVFLFLPWTQNINAKGYVTTKLPSQRPQSVPSVISGKIEKWYVQEGDFVQAGDTIANISEVKSEYFDPKLITRVSEQFEAKNQSVQSYINKIEALDNQYAALKASLELKLAQAENKIEQSKNKIKIDSIDLLAYQINLEIAQNQLDRTTQLFDQGLKSLTELQEKKLKLQESSAKLTVQQNKLINQKNELANLILEYSSIQRDYTDKLAKSKSEQQSAQSDKYSTIAEASKLQNLRDNYSLRQNFYHIIAPQSGYILKTIKKGIGEIVKEGDDIATIMPDDFDPVVEVYLKPQDLPLLKKGDHVNLRFDGWPAIVISGWPESSTGVFPGEIYAIDQYISENGFYRVLISADDKEKTWPDELRVGTGASAFILLRNVPVWYELWRQLNGFPPDFYEEGKNPNEIKRKAPLKSVK